jgi:hypothetical protein
MFNCQMVNQTEASFYLSVTVKTSSPRNLMLTLEFEDAYRVLLVRFSGLHVPEEIAELDRAALEIVAWRGPLRGMLLDYTSVTAVAVSQSFIAQRARLPLISTEYERVFVAPSPELYVLAQAYARQQRDFGIKAPHVVISMPEAYKLLQLERPNFRPIP